ncbi:MAG: phosphotransferase [bacterium]|nr:phosphotransferase [bacterium]
MSLERSALDAWIAHQLCCDAEALEIDTFHDSMTGSVSRVKAGYETFYLKACNAVFPHEPRLTAALYEWFPDRIPPVYGVGDTQGWLLLGDAGETLRTITKRDNDLSRWDKMLREYAVLQRDMIPRTDALLTLGLPDRRLEKLPDLFEQLIADTGALRVGHEDGISEDVLDRLQAFRPQVEALCQQVAEVGIPASIEHDDFHASNVAVRGDEYRIFDWGESCMAHPFYSLLIVLRGAKFLHQADDAALNHLRDVYLEAWTAYAPLERLRELIMLTNQLAALGRALSWQQVYHRTEARFRAEIADLPAYWLRTFLNNTPLEL